MPGAVSVNLLLRGLFRTRNISLCSSIVWYSMDRCRPTPHHVSSEWDVVPDVALGMGTPLPAVDGTGGDLPSARRIRTVKVDLGYVDSDDRGMPCCRVPLEGRIFCTSLLCVLATPSIPFQHLLLPLFISNSPIYLKHIFSFLGVNWFFECILLFPRAESLRPTDEGHSFAAVTT